MEPFGYEALRFAFHPGDVAPGSSARFTAATNSGKGVDLLTDDQVDLERKEWQMVEIPLERFEGGHSLLAGPCSVYGDCPQSTTS